MLKGIFRSFSIRSMAFTFRKKNWVAQGLESLTQSASNVSKLPANDLLKRV